jgi:phage repressor protein C with HTH and peptisase S24 domain
MMLAGVAASVRLGRRVTFKARGNSMQPRIHNNEIVHVRPLAEGELPKKGQVVLARVKGRWYLHLVTAVRNGQAQISNNKGHVNGWTHLSNVIAVLEEKEKE